MTRQGFYPAAALLLWASGSVCAQPTPQHAAACVAALQVGVESLAQQLRDGRTAVEPELLQRVQQGFVFIGAAYKQGVRNEEADRMLKVARAAQADLTPAELASRQAACAAEGAVLLAHANLVERSFVDRAAHRRVERLKGSG